MRRLLLIGTLFLAAAQPAAAQWGEATRVDLDPEEVATCLRDAGGGRVAALAASGGRYGSALYAVGAEGLLPDGDVLFGRRLASCPAVAVAESGAAVAVAVVERRRVARLLVSMREAGGGFGAPVEVARVDGLIIQPVAAVGADGSAAVAWIETPPLTPRRPPLGRLRIARRAPGGAFSAPETLRGRMRAAQPSASHALAFDGAGALTATWVHARPSRGNVRNLSAVDVATAPAGAPFGAAQRLAGEVQYAGRVVLAVTPDGRALLAHDGSERVQVYERAPGAAAFSAGPSAGGDPENGARGPSVALAPDGGAVVAWSDAYGPGIQAIARSDPGAFGPPERLRAAPPDGLSVGLVAVGSGQPVDTDTEVIRVAAAPGGRGAVAWIQDGGRFGDPVSARVAARTPAGFGPPASLGSPVRDVDGVLPWLAGGDIAAVWSDNSTSISLDDTPIAHGRLYVSRSARPAPSSPPPHVTLSARSQALYFSDPLVVVARCAAACDLRASLIPRGKRGPIDERPGAGGGTGSRATPGLVRLRIEPARGAIAPRAGGTVRVVVRATAPGGRAVGRTTLRVRVRRRTPPPFQHPLDMRARRAGEDVIVTWRTAGPARRMLFAAWGRRTRGKGVPRGQELPPFETRSGRGDRRFRLRLDDAGDVRWVVLLASSREPPVRLERIVVRVGR